MRDTSATSRPGDAVGRLLLDNGLQVLWEEDHRQPLVAIEARIKGGLRGEGSYVGTGITHAIEHMLFKGTPSRPPGTIEQEIRRYGGTINAFTSFDVTGISLFVESRYAKDALALLADILQHAVFPPEEFEKERAVIISEIQMNLDDPERRIHQLFWNRHFLEHPYRHPILGYRPLLERLTVADLQQFYAAQYQPPHVVISCVGDLDPSSFVAAAKEIFEAWPRGMADPRQQSVPVEPPAASTKEVTLELPVQSAYGLLGCVSTRLSDPDTYPLDVLANILGHGRSSRLYETVVRKRQVADTVAAWNYTPYDPGVLAIQFRTDPQRVAQATQAILEVLEEVKRHGVTEAELAKAKRSVSAEYLFSLQTIESKAGNLADALIATGDPQFARRYVEGIERVTARQVQEAARRYWDPARMTSTFLQPPAVHAASSPPSTIHGPDISHAVLDNGLTTLIGVDRHLPIAAIVLAFHGGVRVETEETQGLSNLVAQLLIKGTARKKALEIATQVESLGATLEPFSGRDGFGLVMPLLANDLERGLALIEELMSQSTFPEEEVAIQRGLIASQRKAQDDDVFDVGGNLLRRTLFGAHPYRFNPLGEQETIGRLSRSDCLAFATRWVVPSNAVLAVFGDLDPAQVGRLIRRSFGTLSAGTPAWPERLPSETLPGVQTASQHMEREQALIMLGFRGATHQADDRYALDVLTAVLSGMAGRLFQAVRERHGLAYTLGAVHVPGWDPGYLLIYAATRPEEQDNVLNVLQEQLRLTAEQGASEEEVEQAKRYLIGLHRLDVQHLVGLAKRCALDELFGLGFDAWRAYEETIQGVTVPRVVDAAKRYLTIQQHAQVIISPNGRHDAERPQSPP